MPPLARCDSKPRGSRGVAVDATNDGVGPMTLSELDRVLGYRPTVNSLLHFGYHDDVTPSFRRTIRHCLCCLLFARDRCTCTALTRGGSVSQIAKYCLEANEVLSHFGCASRPR